MIYGDDCLRNPIIIRSYIVAFLYYEPNKKAVRQQVSCFFVHFPFGLAPDRQLDSQRLPVSLAKCSRSASKANLRN
jgi:hypothetical protein